MADDCLFCRLVLGEIPSDRVLETDDLIAFRDIAPQAPTHILIIPRDHIASLSDAGEDHRALLGSIQLAAVELARAEGIDEAGWRLVTNVGDEGGQSVHHLHYHLVGGRRLGWPPG
jgi:histidine triad (HIT) family protein